MCTCSNHGLVWNLLSRRSAVPSDRTSSTSSPDVGEHGSLDWRPVASANSLQEISRLVVSTRHYPITSPLSYLPVASERTEQAGHPSRGGVKP